jgi:hypothetical protein
MIGRIHSKKSCAVRVSTAISPETAVSRNTTPHMSVSWRLITLNPVVFQRSRGVVSRAYCSVNGVDASETNAMTARAPDEMTWAYFSSQSSPDRSTKIAISVIRPKNAIVPTSSSLRPPV